MIGYLKTIASFLLTILVTVVLAEGLLYLLRPEMDYALMPQLVMGDFYDESPLVEFTLKKKYEGRFLRSAATFDSLVKTNTLGWRDTEPDSREKILVFGDSLVFGYGLNNGETIPDQLEKLSDNKADFVNLGLTAGGSPDSYAVYLRSHKELHGKKIIVLIFTNDLNDMFENYCVDSGGNEVNVWDSSCVRNIKKNAFIKDGELFKNKSFMAMHMSAEMRQLMKRSYLIAVLRNSLASSQESLEVEEKPLPSLEKLYRSIDVLRSFSQKLAVLTVTPKGCGGVPDRFYEMIKKYSKNNGIFYDQIPEFAAENYWIRDAHYNRDGSQKVAEFIYSRLPRDFQVQPKIASRR